MENLSKNFEWLKNIETKHEKEKQKLITTIETIESRIINKDFSIGTETRKALEYTFYMYSEKPESNLSQFIKKYNKQHNLDAIVFYSLKIIQKLGNSDSHATTDDQIKIETESDAICLLKHTHDAIISIFSEINLIREAELENISFDFRVYFKTSEYKEKEQEDLAWEIAQHLMPR